MFLKNKSLQVSVVPKAESAAPTLETIEATTVKLIDKINPKVVVKTVSGGLAVYAAVVAINTAARIAENRFTPQV